MARIDAREGDLKCFDKDSLFGLKTPQNPLLNEKKKKYVKILMILMKLALT